MASFLSTGDKVLVGKFFRRLTSPSGRDRRSCTEY